MKYLIYSDIIDGLKRYTDPSNRLVLCSSKQDALNIQEEIIFVNEEIWNRMSCDSSAHYFSMIIEVTDKANSAVEAYKWIQHVISTEYDELEAASSNSTSFSGMNINLFSCYSNFEEYNDTQSLRKACFTQLNLGKNPFE